MIRRRTIAACAATLCTLLATGCGKNFAPPAATVTGREAGPLEPHWDLDVELPNLQVEGAPTRGASLTLELRLARAGTGTIDATVTEASAKVAGGMPIVTIPEPDFSVVDDGTRWQSSRIGPLAIDGTIFSLFLDGTRDAAGYRVTGAASETQTALGGSFGGWRRQRFLVAGSDFFGTSGTLALVSWVRDERIEVDEALESVGADCVVRSTAQGVWAVNRLTFDNVQRLDPAGAFRTVWQAPLGTLANPHDLVAAPDGTLFVTRYEPPFDDVALLDPGDGEVLASIDLSSLATNADGTPRADRMALVGDRLFVALQDIDRTFTEYGEGRLAVVDVASRTLLGEVTLGRKNPSALVPVETPAGTRLIVATAGIYPGLLPRELSGGIVEVDPESLLVVREIVDDDLLEGNVGDIAVGDAGVAWSVVSGTNGFNRVVALRLSDGVVLGILFQTQAFVPEVALAGGSVLAIPDRTIGATSLCLWDVESSSPGDPGQALGCASLAVSPFSVVALDR